MSRHGPKIWQPLNVAEKQIRLLVLDPSSDFTAPLSGHLRTVSLNDKPSYDAISHAWGQASDIRTLHIDGCSLMITSGVDTCLRYVRHEAGVQPLWIDAVCVHQQDLRERGSQVALMRYIFGQAGTVHVWLGWGQHQVEKLMEHIARPEGSNKGPGFVWDIDSKQDPQLLLLRLRVSLLLSEDWWSRLWTRQEVVLAKTVRLHYGSVNVKLQQFTEWSESLRRLDVHGISFLDCRTQAEGLGNLRAVVSAGAPDDLVVVLTDSRTSSAADARDRVYGQLGIVSAVLQQDIMSTDYALSTEEVYTKFAFSLVRTSRSLRILNQASTRYNSLQALPTWVPDWTSRYRFGREKLRFLRSIQFQATAGRTMPAPRLASTTTYPATSLLGVQGHTFAVSTSVGPACEDLSEHLELARFVLSEWEPLFREWHENYDSTHQPSPSESPTVVSSVSTQFAATMVRGASPTQDREDPERMPNDAEAEPVFNAMIETCAASPNSLEHNLVMELIRMGISSTRFFIDSDGRPGLGPPDVESGDVLALLLGGNVPYVLRKDDADAGTNVYTFVGECYVHGAMDGELFDEDSVQDIWLV